MVTQAVQPQKIAFNHPVMRHLFRSKEVRMSELGLERINLLAGSRINKKE